MDHPEIIYNYFKDLIPEQKNQFSKLASFYQIWNRKINVISRKDLDHLYERHVLHSLGISRIIHFKSNTTILDVGTGGGFPGIPLAILFPECRFHLIDSIGKKIKVVRELVIELELKNVTTQKIRVEDLREKYDFVLSRAVTKMKPFYDWVKDKITKRSFNDLDNGLICLKGGDIEEEMNELNKSFQSFELKNYYSEEFFESKKIIYVPLV